MSSNRLGRETSPYLIQHKDNPVHWWAWGPEALAEAKRTNKPILLSVGYAACHWCHVMAHESFEDETTAALMNDLYVNIKVDREERPDIDAIYMGALHRLGEQGGWPLTMFLAPDARPFWGGTYFPPQARWGKPSFQHVLREVERIFRDEPDKVRHNSELLVDMLKPEDTAGQVNIADAHLAEIATRMVQAVDPINGGLQGAPKFPQWSFFWFLWRVGISYDMAPARAAVANTLTHIAQGGIYDHLGGGFARYSVDERWLAPHFEKMLYDNALLLDLMTEVYRENADPLLRARIEETVAWLERDMIAEGGGFASALDADSEGEEGKFYVWSAAEIENVLGAEDASFFASVYDVTPEGNWEGHTILNRLRSLALLPDADEQRLAAMRGKLLARRSGRVRPGWDDKVLADWNGLMIAALAKAARVFQRPAWLAMAERAFAFVQERMTINGRLVHAYRLGQAKSPATASDYANMILAAIRLHEVTAEQRYLTAAQEWLAVLERHYWVSEGGGYAMTADDTPDVIVRLKSAHDDATPNANAIMLGNLAHLFLLTGETGYIERAEAIPHAFAADLRRTLTGHTGLLAGILDVMRPQQVVILSGQDATAAERMRDALYSLSLPGALQQVLDGTVAPATPALAGKTAVGGTATAYVCTGTQCSAPITDADALGAALRREREVDAGENA